MQVSGSSLDCDLVEFFILVFYVLYMDGCNIRVMSGLVKIVGELKNYFSCLFFGW